nr:MAG TPA: hypothetical protein [Caudoviricetes sp.]
MCSSSVAFKGPLSFFVVDFKFSFCKGLWAWLQCFIFEGRKQTFHVKENNIEWVTIDGGRTS